MCIIKKIYINAGSGFELGIKHLGACTYWKTVNNDVGQSEAELLLTPGS